ncbi:hypothetical protein U0035_00695 [Niabella yanshanensis]|uniref:Uncharacterized protein n=1 Tax=Niabella yanshanensis TaxID=577386 RepID=A0ABZ0W5W7_9BACT|nr:hypothetical protein [Niabella yanshanensis]WQD38663.1 hypothetical protein U0035_00695 [Niabella yanshanensis]
MQIVETNPCCGVILSKSIYWVERNPPGREENSNQYHYQQEIKLNTIVSPTYYKPAVEQMNHKNADN